MYSCCSHLPVQFILRDNLMTLRVMKSLLTFTRKHEEQLYIPSFGVQFSPVKFSAQNHSTSELLRTLLMSGCF